MKNQFIFYIYIPKFINIQYKNLNYSSILWISGPLGTLVYKFNNILVFKKSFNKLFIQLNTNNFTYLYKKLLIFFINVSKVTQKLLQITGVGYKFLLNNYNLIISIGLSHQYFLKLDRRFSYYLYKKAAILKISGLNYFKLTSLYHKIRLIKKPDIYKAKGISFYKEIIKLKQGKKDIY